MPIVSIGAVTLILATVSASAFAQPEAASAAPGEPGSESSNDIIVAATKKAGGETLQKAGVAVTALGAAQLEAANVKSISDIAGQAPNVSMLGGSNLEVEKRLEFASCGRLDFERNTLLDDDYHVFRGAHLDDGSRLPSEV